MDNIYGSGKYLYFIYYYIVLFFSIDVIHECAIFML